MTKNDYIASQLALGKTHSKIIAEQPTELVQGSLLKKHYQEIKTILASGLRLHLDEYVPSTEHGKLAICALRETFDPQYLADEDFKVNFNVPKVEQLFQLCVDVGALPQEFANELRELAKYEKPIYDITQADFVGLWHDLGEISSHQLTIRLKQKAPEQTYILVQSRDIFDDGIYGDWRHNTACYLESSGVYICKIRAESRQEVRWSCAYALDVEVG